MKTFSQEWHRQNRKRRERHIKNREMSKERRMELKKLKEGRSEQS